MSKRKYGVTASPAVQRAVSRLIRDVGLARAAEMLGIGENATGRLGSGAQVTNMTFAVASVALQKITDSTKRVA